VKNSKPLKGLKFERAEGRAALDDLRPRLRTMRHTAYLVRIFRRFSIFLKNRVRFLLQRFKKFDNRGLISFAQAFKVPCDDARFTAVAKDGIAKCQ